MNATERVVEVENLQVRYEQRQIFRTRGITAVRGVGFSIEAGRTLGIAGESGSGKSTIARALMRIIDSHSGSARIAGQDVLNLKGDALRRFRRHMQMVFQDPYDALNPRLTSGQNVAEALVATGVARAKHPERIRGLFDRVGLPSSFADRYPHELSGGQRQRVSIARALAVNPSVLVCDEAVSALDVSIRAQILNLLKDLQEETGIALLFISHDLSTLRFIAHDIAIMYFGRIVEMASSSAVFAQPRHPYTQSLIAAITEPGTARVRPRTRLAGETPSHRNPPSGCAFAARCPIATDLCRTDDPPLRTVGDSQVACHHAEESPMALAAHSAAQTTDTAEEGGSL